MTTINIFARLKQMLPPPPLLIGTVLELHPDDDTSTVQLLMAGSTQTYDEALKTGNIIRARGQFVPVGQNAFIRNGVIETKAPDDIGDEIVVGRVVTPSAPLTFSPNIGAQTGTTATPFTLDVSTHWHGGVAPLRYTVASGTLPSGLSLDSVSGVLGGTVVSPASATMVLRATDASAVAVDSDAFTMGVIDGGPNYLVIGRFDGSLANGGTLGGSWTLATAQAQLSTAQIKYGTGSLLQHSVPYTVTGGGSGATPNPAIATFSNASLDIALGTPKTLGFWFYVPNDGTGTPAFRGATTLDVRWCDAGGSVAGLNVLIAYQATTMEVYAGAGILLNGTPAVVSRGAWHHVAVAADSANTVRWFVDGVLKSGTRTLTAPLAALTKLQATSQGGDCPDIYVDDLYFQIGAAPTASFTPPGAL